jgi:hypothetical protein
MRRFAFLAFFFDVFLAFLAFRFFAMVFSDDEI